MLKEADGWYDFLKLLSENAGYTYLISLDGAYDNGEQPLQEILTGMGMPEEIASKGGVWIHGPETEEAFAAGEAAESHLSLGSSDLLVRKSAAGTELIFDKENQWKTANGLNIMVYDEFTKSLVTAVGFDAFSGYQCVY